MAPKVCWTAIILAIAAVATKFTSPKIEVALILIGLVLLFTATVRMLMLPQMF